MGAQPAGGHAQQQAVEAGVGEALLDLADALARHAEAHQPQGQVDPVGAPEGFHQVVRRFAGAGELMVLDDHGVDIVGPVGQVQFIQVMAGQARGGAQVIEGAGQPDAGVVEKTGQFHLAQVVTGQRPLRRHQVDDPVHMVAIGGLVPAEAFRVVIEQGVQLRQFGDQRFHDCPRRPGRPTAFLVSAINHAVPPLS